MYTATSLRKNIYAVLDSVLESGIPAEIERHGKRLRIVPGESAGRLDRLEEHSIVNGPSEELADLHWDDAWTGMGLPG